MFSGKFGVLPVQSVISSSSRSLRLRHYRNSASKSTMLLWSPETKCLLLISLLRQRDITGALACAIICSIFKDNVSLLHWLCPNKSVSPSGLLNTGDRELARALIWSLLHLVFLHTLLEFSVMLVFNHMCVGLASRQRPTHSYATIYASHRNIWYVRQWYCLNVIVVSELHTILGVTVLVVISYT